MPIAPASTRDANPAVHTSRFGGTGPEWSPDGTRIAFYDGEGLRLIDPDGTDLTKLEVTGGRPTGVVAWQPLP